MNLTTSEIHLEKDALVHIAFHIEYPEFFNILNPIFKILKDEFICVLEEDIDKIIELRPKILVVPNWCQLSIFRKRLPSTIIILLRHGFSYKNNADRFQVSDCDFTNDVSEWTRDFHVKLGLNPGIDRWVTGFSLMDDVISNSYSQPKLPNTFKKKGRTLLYAPTFNPTLTAIKVLGFEWIKTLNEMHPDLNLIIKPHPMIIQHHLDWMESFKEVSNNNPQIYLVENQLENIYHYFPQVDILLTDVSSVMFYFLYFDKPIITVTNPAALKDLIHFNQNDPEWAWRDLSIEITTLEQLNHAIKSSIDYPEEKQSIRQQYKQRVFDDNGKGKATRIIADKIHALLQPRDKAEPWVKAAWKNLYIRMLNQQAEEIIKLEEEIKLKEQLLQAMNQRLSIKLATYIHRYPRISQVIKKMLTGLINLRTLCSTKQQQIK